MEENNNQPTVTAITGGNGTGNLNHQGQQNAATAK